MESQNVQPLPRRSYFRYHRLCRAEFGKSFCMLLFLATRFRPVIPNLGLCDQTWPKSCVAPDLVLWCTATEARWLVLPRTQIAPCIVQVKPYKRSDAPDETLNAVSFAHFYSWPLRGADLYNSLPPMSPVPFLQGSFTSCIKWTYNSRTADMTGLSNRASIRVVFTSI